LSHSSRDKPLVRRIAAELLLECVPVWLDQWEIGVGDPLDKNLAEAVQRADYLALCISHSAVKSGWVDRELNMALVCERQLGRVFVLPIRLDDTDVPLQVADRLYADFAATSFSAGVRQLVNRVRAHRVDKSYLDDLQITIPLLLLADGITINPDRLSQFLSQVASTRARNDTFTPRIVVVESEDMEQLSGRCRAKLSDAQGLATSKYLAEIESYLHSLESLSEFLVAGATEIIAAMLHRSAYETAVAIHWFTKEVQARRLRKMSGGLTETDDLWKVAARFKGDDLAFFRSLYDADEVRKMDFWLDHESSDGSKKRTVISAWIDVQEQVWDSLRCSGQFGNPAICDAVDSAQVGPKYLIPRQMWDWFFAKTYGCKSQPLEWDFKGWHFGPG